MRNGPWLSAIEVKAAMNIGVHQLQLAVLSGIANLGLGHKSDAKCSITDELRPRLSADYNDFSFWKDTLYELRDGRDDDS